MIGYVNGRLYWLSQNKKSVIYASNSNEHWIWQYQWSWKPNRYQRLDVLKFINLSRIPKLGHILVGNKKAFRHDNA